MRHIFQCILYSDLQTQSSNSGGVQLIECSEKYGSLKSMIKQEHSIKCKEVMCVGIYCVCIYNIYIRIYIFFFFSQLQYMKNK